MALKVPMDHAAKKAIKEVQVWPDRPASKANKVSRAASASQALWALLALKEPLALKERRDLEATMVLLVIEVLLAPWAAMVKMESQAQSDQKA